MSMSVRSTLIAAFDSLSARINKRNGDSNDEVAEGVIGSRLPELTLDLDNDALVKLSDTWEGVWNDSDVKGKWTIAGDENENYWKGEHYKLPELANSRPIKDNAIFQGLETYLPQVTRRNPEVTITPASLEDMGEASMQYARALQAELNELADDVKLRLKLKGTARNWSVRLVGVLKFGWDLENDRPAIKVIRPTKMILDPDATVDEDGYSGDRVGEHKKLAASKLVDAIKLGGAEDAEQTIEWVTTDLAKGDMATEIGFIEWWTPDYTFWKVQTRVLVKRKNPHWNYDPQEEEKPKGAPEDKTEGNVEGITEDQSDASKGAAPEQSDVPPEGVPKGPALPNLGEVPTAPPKPTKGFNHFKTRRMPYLFLSIYNLGKQPVDVTSIMGQNLSNQDLINKRIRQIDKNADTANNGLVVSLERSGLTKDQAKGVTTALRKGGVVAIPTGAPQEAVYKPPMNELPVYVYNQLVDTRTRVMDIWGTRGSSPAGIENESTVRGKIVVKGLDTDRIGGGISEYLEQLSQDAFDWLIQLLYVYDDRFVAEIQKGTPIPRVKAKVKEGSLLPKDATTIANQALELATGGKMALVDMYKRLDYANPEELAANVWLEANAPEILLNDPRIKQVIAQRQQAAQQAGATAEKKPPSVSINYKDLPPDGQAQAAAQAGIELHPEAVAANEMHREQRTAPPTTVPLPTGGGP